MGKFPSEHQNADDHTPVQANDLRSPERPSADASPEGAASLASRIKDVARDRLQGTNPALPDDKDDKAPSDQNRQKDGTAPQKESEINTKNHHRKRMRDKLFQAGADALTDHEILEMALYSAMPRIDNKPLVKKLLAEYQTIGGVVHAPRHELQRFHHVGEVVAANLQILAEISSRVARDAAKDKPILDNWAAVERFCITKLAHCQIEQFMVLFLDNQNRLIRDVILSKGTTDRTAIYPKELVKRTIQENASAVILVHNHPSYDQRPSHADIQITKQIKQALDTIQVRLHDHLIIAGKHVVSFAALGLL